MKTDKKELEAYKNLGFQQGYHSASEKYKYEIEELEKKHDIVKTRLEWKIEELKDKHKNELHEKGMTIEVLLAKIKNLTNSK